MLILIGLKTQPYACLLRNKNQRVQEDLAFEYLGLPPSFCFVCFAGLHVICKAGSQISSCFYFLDTRRGEGMESSCFINTTASSQCCQKGAIFILVLLDVTLGGEFTVSEPKLWEMIGSWSGKFHCFSFLTWHILILVQKE